MILLYLEAQALRPRSISTKCNGCAIVALDGSVRSLPFCVLPVQSKHALKKGRVCISSRFIKCHNYETIEYCSYLLSRKSWLSIKILVQMQGCQKFSEKAAVRRQLGGCAFYCKYQRHSYKPRIGEILANL